MLLKDSVYNVYIEEYITKAEEVLQRQLENLPLINWLQTLSNKYKSQM